MYVYRVIPMYLWHQVLPSKLIPTCMWSNAFKNRINSANLKKSKRKFGKSMNSTGMQSDEWFIQFNHEKCLQRKKDESEFQSKRKFYNESVSICQIRYGYVRE